MAKLTFTGLYSDKVFGVFKVLRGFASLKELAQISQPFNYPEGYQREIDQKHAEELKAFFASTKGNKFIPEIILGLRCKDGDQTIVVQDKGELKEIVIDTDLLAQNPVIIRRIDGNHRLYLAKELPDDTTRPNQYIIPFAMILLRSLEEKEDNIAEALIFHAINSKGKPITSEHGFNVILNTENDEQKLFDEDASVFTLKYIKERSDTYSGNFSAVFGKEKLTNIHRVVKMMVVEEVLKLTTKEEVKASIDKIFDQVHQVFIWAKIENFEMVKYFKIIPAIILILKTISLFDETKIENVKIWLKSYNLWLKSNKMLEEFDEAEPSQLWKIFKKWKDNQPKNIFVACSLSSRQEMESVRNMIKEAIEKIKTDYPDINIQQIRIDEHHGESFELTQKLFTEIDAADLVIADLTEEKQNVYCEIGYAKAKNKRFILTYKPKDESDGNLKNKIHQDLIPYKYIQYNQVDQLRDKLIEDIKAIYDKS